MTDQPRLSPEVVYDQRKALVKEMLDKENAVRDAKTARLRALRLAKDASQPPAPIRVRAKPRRKKAG